MGNRKKRKTRELQLAFDFNRSAVQDRAFASRVDGALDEFRREVARKGPKAVARTMGLARVAPHWRRIGGAR